ncbi:hypothetical protein DPX16_10696 [Anabarilius grahami]|uniref:Uncharacterized protein n=1 Tax=Anabarilius grahami TaxID=495550 RepID=A0A3N0Z7H5_ANAGA|nr:hypothetical protein DPX16_10696 [Anabarilius grahami]
MSYNGAVSQRYWLMRGEQGVTTHSPHFIKVTYSTEEKRLTALRAPRQPLKARERVLAESRQKWWRVALTPLHSSSSQSEQLGLRSRSPARTGYCTDDIYVSAAPEGPT